MGRHYLFVPFEEKDEAKLLGARWDPKARSWWIPDYFAKELFSRWLYCPEDQQNAMKARIGKRHAKTIEAC